MQETWVWSLGSGISSREGNGATHSSILAWRIPWKRSLAGYCPQGCKESDITEQDLTSRKCWRIYKTPVRANKQIQQSYRIQKSTYKNQLYFYLPVISDQKKMEKTIPFMRVSKKNQILKNLTKKVKDLYTETANVTGRSQCYSLSRVDSSRSVDRSPPGSSIYGILQARKLE